MTDIKETAEEVKEYIVARLKVPVFFYYLLSLAVWNWDILLMILKSDFQIETVIAFIKNNYNGHQRLWIPLLIAIASSIVFPSAMVGLDWLLKYVNIARIKSAKEVAVEEAKAQYIVQTERNKTDVLKDLNTKISLNESEISELKDSNFEYSEKISKLIDESKKDRSDLSIVQSNNESLRLQIKELKETDDFKYIVDNEKRLIVEFENFIKQFRITEILETLDEAISGIILNIDNTEEILKILNNDRYIENVANKNINLIDSKRLTKKGFALKFYILGRLNTNQRI